jgi:FkbH-like protein
MISDAARNACESIEEGRYSDAIFTLRALVNESLGAPDAQAMSRRLLEHRGPLIEFLSRPPLRLAVLGGYTTHAMADALRVMLFSAGIFADIDEGEFNSIHQQILDPRSRLYSLKPDLILVAQGWMNIASFPDSRWTGAAIDDAAVKIAEDYRSLCLKAGGTTGARVILHTFDPLPCRGLGRLEDRYAWSRSRFVQRVNDFLWQRDGDGFRLLDVHSLAERVGLDRWHDPRWVYHGRHGFNPEMAIEYGRTFMGLFRALMGQGLKCLVTDLDGVLWGGVLGDDGPQGIHLGSHSPLGEAHRAFCLYLRQLKDRGVLLAVNSKNDREFAESIFIDHPEMPLKRTDFAAFCCNWNNKSANLVSLAEQLNIGLESMVFIDDSPVECLEVRRLKPEVTVIEMSEDPAYFVHRLDRLGLFDQLDITREDLSRSESYGTTRILNEVKANAADISTFLASLDMRGDLRFSEEPALARIEQLFNKTNQFNMSQRRYDRATLRNFMGESSKFCVSCWLKDSTTNYGLVSALVGDVRGHELYIDNWVMSCRVFSRTLEEYIHAGLVSLAEKHGCSSIRMNYVPGVRNEISKRVLDKLGFAPQTGQEDFSRVMTIPGARWCQTFVRNGIDETDARMPPQGS